MKQNHQGEIQGWQFNQKLLSFFFWLSLGGRGTPVHYIKSGHINIAARAISKKTIGITCLSSRAQLFVP